MRIHLSGKLNQHVTNVQGLEENVPLGAARLKGPQTLQYTVGQKLKTATNDAVI